MKVLLTGATGFLGSHLCRRMIEDGHDLRVLCRPSSDTAILTGAPLECVTGDVTDFESVRAAVSGSDWVIHSAAILQGNRELQMRVNVEGTRNIAKACRMEGVKRLLHVSSVAAIGIPSDPRSPASEHFAFNLERSGLVYHLSKWRAEKEIEREAALGLNAVIVNPASLKGPYRTQYHGAEIVKAVRRAPIVPYFAGGVCVVHVQDVVDGILRALQRGVIGQRYILGGENVTFRGLAERTSAVLGLRRKFLRLPPAVTGLAAAVFECGRRLFKFSPLITYQTHYCANRFQFYDSSKAVAALGYRPRAYEAILDECLRLAAC